MKLGGKSVSTAHAVAIVGICAATLECGKLALAAIPNFEVVTLLCALYAYSFGWLGVLATVVFVCIEPIIYGFGSWIITYFIYWPLVAIIFMLLRRARIKNRWILTAVAVGMTFLFGVISALVDVGLFSGSYDNFLYRFAIYYARGIIFYAVEIGCNALLFPLLFNFLSDKLIIIKRKIIK